MMDEDEGRDAISGEVLGSLDGPAPDAPELPEADPNALNVDVTENVNQPPGA